MFHVVNFNRIIWIQWVPPYKRIIGKMQESHYKYSHEWLKVISSVFSHSFLLFELQYRANSKSKLSRSSIKDEKKFSPFHANVYKRNAMYGVNWTLTQHRIGMWESQSSTAYYFMFCVYADNKTRENINEETFNLICFPFLSLWALTRLSSSFAATMPELFVLFVDEWIHCVALFMPFRLELVSIWLFLVFFRDFTPLQLILLFFSYFNASLCSFISGKLTQWGEIPIMKFKQNWIEIFREFRTILCVSS